MYVSIDSLWRVSETKMTCLKHGTESNSKILFIAAVFNNLQLSPISINSLVEYIQL